MCIHSFIQHVPVTQKERGIPQCFSQESLLAFLRFFTCVSWSILASANLVDRAEKSYASLNFFFLLFSYVSSFWNLEAWLYMFLLFFFVFFYLCSLSCPSFYSFLLFFLFPVLFTPSLFIHFIFWSPLLFPFQICCPFFSLFSILSAPPLCAITIGSVLFL